MDISIVVTYGGAFKSGQGHNQRELRASTVCFTDLDQGSEMII